MGRLVTITAGVLLAVITFAAGAWAEPVYFDGPYNHATGSSPRKLVSADFNNDGRPDLAVASSGMVSILLNDGAGSFAPAVNVTAGSFYAAITAADFNGDGNQDVVVTNPTAGTASILLGNGDGTFQPMAMFPSGGDLAVGIVAGDFNGDGKQDVAIAHEGSSAVCVQVVCITYPCPCIPQPPDYTTSANVSLLMGNGDGTFQGPARYSIAGRPEALTTADLDGDGRLDLAAVNVTTRKISILLGLGNGSFQSPMSVGSLSDMAVDILATDLNGDGVKDLVVVNDSNVSVLMGAGQNVYVNGSSTYIGRPRSVATGDFDSDGNVDLVVSQDSGGNNIALLPGKGDGTFLPSEVYTAGGNLQGIQAADFDGNGKLDVAVANSGSSSASILLNRGLKAVSPTSATFTGTKLNVTSSPQSFVISNTTGAPLTVSSCSIEGTDAAMFSLAQTGSCPVVPFPLEPGASCTIGIVFTPTAFFSRSASLAVVLTGNEGHTEAVALNGQSEPNRLTMSWAGEGSGTMTYTDNTTYYYGPVYRYFYSSDSVATVTATPAPDSTFVAWLGCDFVDGTNCTVAMDSDRTVTAQFDLSSSLLVPPAHVSIAAGSSHSLGVGPDGAVWGWGRNNDGQLGDSTKIDRSTAVAAAEMSGVAAVAGGFGHTLALKEDGKVWAWGNNIAGDLGNGSSVQSSTPVPVWGISGITAVDAGVYHSIALKGDGTVWTWGSNGYGQLGDGTTTGRSVPVQSTGLTGMVAVAAGAYHTVALKGDGTVWTWGSNSYGQLGDGSTTQRTTPARLTGLTGVVAIAAGDYHTIALKSDGAIWAWGNNWYGQLGLSPGGQVSVPVQVTSLSSVAALAAGTYHSLALKYDGTVWAWGQNSYGQLGTGTVANSATPLQVSGLLGVTAIAAGGNHSLALNGNGSVSAWGANAFGMLGDGTTTQRLTPVAVQGLNLGPQAPLPPDTIITTGPGSMTRATSFSFTFTSTIPGSTFECNYNGTGYNACSSPYAPLFFAPLSDGRYTFSVRALSPAGVYDSTPATHTWIIDTMPPGGSVAINDGAASTVSRDVTLTINANASIPGLVCVMVSPFICGAVDMQLSNDGSTWTAWEPARISVPWQLPDGNGPKTVQARLRDPAGNIKVVTDTISLAVPPSSAVTSPGNGSSVNTSCIALTGTSSAVAGASVATVDVSTDGGSTWSTASGTGTWNYSWCPAGEGTYTVVSRATDSTSVVETPKTGITITVDRTPPSGTLAWGIGEYVLNASDGGTCVQVYPNICGDLEMLLSNSMNWQAASTRVPLDITHLQLRDRAGNTRYIPAPASWNVGNADRIQEAINSIPSSTDLKVSASSYAEDLAFTREGTFRFSGGYDSTFSAVSGKTLVTGRVTIAAGSVSLANMRIRGELSVEGGCLEAADVIVE